MVNSCACTYMNICPYLAILQVATMPKGIANWQSVYVSILLCVHLKNDVFSICLPSPLHPLYY